MDEKTRALEREARANPQVGDRHRLKHAVDRLLALGALPWVLPPVVLASVAIRLEDLLTGEGRRAVFYRERRYSAGQPFDLLKLRVIRASALDRHLRAGNTTVKELEHDPANVTRVGRLLVRYYLDELPQLFHVLGGTMSFVGPRPQWPHDVDRRDYFAALGMKAGLAGTFQLAKGEADIFTLDKRYVEEYERRSQLGLLVYEARILLQTLRKMVQGEGL